MRHMKQETVAKQMGISQAAYSKIENNLTELTVRHCKVLSKIFDINVYDFLEDDFEISRGHSQHGAKNANDLSTSAPEN